MQTEITIAIGTIITGIITLDKLGVLDKIFKRNGKSNATKQDIDVLKENHFHELNQKLDRTERKQDQMIELLQKAVFILEDLKNKKP